MGDSSDRSQLSVQDHPTGRVELTANRSFLEEFRSRSFTESDISQLFHENTKFDERYLHRSSLTASDLPDDIAAVEQDYHGAETVALPEPDPLECELQTVLEGRRSVRAFANRGVSESELGTILGRSVRPTTAEDAGDVSDTARPYPSAGGLFPIEVYPVVVNGQSLADGTYYYSPRTHSLRRLETETGETLAAFEACFMDAEFSREIVSESAVTFVLTSCFSRIKAKYGPVGYRFALLEAGHLAQNLLLTAEALGMGGVPLGSFLDDQLDEFLGVDGVNEGALYPIAIGHPTTNE